MARLSKRYGPKGAFAPERLPPPPEPEPPPKPEPEPASPPAFSSAPPAISGDALAGVDATALRTAVAENLWWGGDGAESPVVPVRGEGCRVWDTEGREYLDGRAGESGANLGHGRGEITAAMATQLTHLAVAPPAAPSVPAALLAARLAALAPTYTGRRGFMAFAGDDTEQPAPADRVLFAPGGSEAVELALHIAKAYQRARGFPGRYRAIAHHHARHGDTAGALALSGQAHRRTPFEPLVPGVVHVAPPDPARFPEAGDGDAIGRAISLAGPESVAAVIVEPVQGHGVVAPPPGYLARVRAACDAHGVLLIADETTCGMGRVGTLFACDTFEVRPDIVVVGNGLTGGYAALGAVIVSRAVADALQEEVRDLFAGRSSFPGLPVAAAAALAALALLERDELPGRSRDMGAYLLRELETAVRDHPNAGAVRGIGMWLAVDLVRDRDSRAPFDDPAALRTLADETRRRGLLCRVAARPFPVVELAPPFTVERDDGERMIATLAAALDTLRQPTTSDTPGDGSSGDGHSLPVASFGEPAGWGAAYGRPSGHGNDTETDTEQEASP